MSGIEGRNPYDDYETINNELRNFNSKIMDKPQIIIANKMDIDSAKENLKQFKEKVKYPVYEISAINSQGLDKVINELSNTLDKIEKLPLYEEEKFESHVLYKFKEEQPFTITKDNYVWVVRGDEVERLLRMTKFNTEEAARRFTLKLRKMGIDDKLKELDAKSGDTVRILDFEFEYQE